MALPEIEALARRIDGITGHEVFAYGQSSYDGDACRSCPWQGPPHSGKKHVADTRTAAIAEVLQAYLDERIDPRDVECTCGYSGYHGPENPRCARNQI